MAVCCLSNCKSRKKSRQCNISFFRFPVNDKKLLKVWESNVRRNGEIRTSTAKHRYVCAKHFLPSDFFNTANTAIPVTKRRLKKGAFPSVFDWNDNSTPCHKIMHQNKPECEEELEFLPVDNFILGENVEIFDEDPLSTYSLDKSMPESPIQIKVENDDAEFIDTEEYQNSECVNIPIVKQIFESKERIPQIVEKVKIVNNPPLCINKIVECCGVAKCGKTEKDGVILHSIPVGFGCIAASVNGEPCLLTLTKVWSSLALVNVGDKVCSDHFLPEDYNTGGENCKLLRPDAIPSQNLPAEFGRINPTPKCSLLSENNMPDAKLKPKDPSLAPAATQQVKLPTKSNVIRQYSSRPVLKIAKEVALASHSQENQNNNLKSIPCTSKSDMPGMLLTQTLQTNINKQKSNSQVDIYQGIKDLCRICGLFSLDPMVWILSTYGHNRKLQQKIYKFLDITVSTRDVDLPMGICKSCNTKLEECQNFADLAAKTNCSLKTLSSRPTEISQPVVQRQIHLRLQNNSNLEQYQHSTAQLTNKVVTTEITHNLKHHEEKTLKGNSSSIQQELDLKRKESLNKSNNFVFDKKCSQCSMLFNRDSVRDTHLRTFHNSIECKKCNVILQCDEYRKHKEENHMIKCNFCDKHVNDPPAFKNHVKNWHPELLPKYVSLCRPDEEFSKCNLCDYTCGNKRSIKNHYMWTHQLFACDVCLQVFQTLEEQNSHTAEIHLMPCLYCDEKFFTERRLKRHMGKKHKVQSSKSIKKIHKNSEHIFECQFCKKGLTTNFNLQRHNFWCHSKYTCIICSSAFLSAELEEDHFKTHGHMCVWCEIRYKSDVELKEHVQCVHPEQTKTFCCETCGDCFDERVKLNEHKIAHKLNETFLCYICGKKFKGNTKLTNHLNGHRTEDEKQKECNICHKKFLFESQLKSHMLKHTKEKSFKCSDCDKLFISHSYLEKHMKIHLGDNSLKCDFCNLNFDTKTNLITHIENIHFY